MIAHLFFSEIVHFVSPRLLFCFFDGLGYQWTRILPNKTLALTGNANLKETFQTWFAYQKRSGPGPYGHYCPFDDLDQLRPQAPKCPLGVSGIGRANLCNGSKHCNGINPYNGSNPCSESNSFKPSITFQIFTYFQIFTILLNILNINKKS